MISGKTALVGLIGQPVQHSLSPVMHNAALKAMGLDWCYLALPCESSELTKVLQSLRALKCKGLNITIPHKQTITGICSQLSPLAKKVGAVNTLIPDKIGGWIGTNTDVAGFIAPLMGRNQEWRKSKAIVLGCGGSARAVVAGLQDMKIFQITVVGRKEEKLRNFLDHFNNAILKNNSIDTPGSLKGILENEDNLLEEIKKADLIINTTPIGMHRDNKNNDAHNQIPLGVNFWNNLKTNTTLYDLVYTPRPTAWLQLGQKKGYNCIDGLEMLIQQGAASLKLWSNYNEIPVNVMRSAAEKSLLFKNYK